MSKVCLIDGSGYIFRAFYALPNMTAPDGTPVNAVYGFITMFMRLLKNVDCDYCVVFFDAKRENFRNEYFADYKANRVETPELLIPQFELIHQVVRVMNLPYVMQEGYEADDLIATYAKQAVDEGLEAVIVSADKDLMQLIRKGVCYYDGMKDKYYTPDDVKAKFGVYPDKVTDVQALAGDSTDNIPGVPGIGIKTAAELVNEFGSLENILENADKIKQNKRRELITANKDNALISLKLVTLKDDVPVETNISDFKCQAPDMHQVLEFADKLGFKSIRPKLEQWVKDRCASIDPAAKIGPEAAPEEEVKWVDLKDKSQLDELQSVIKKKQKVALQTMVDDDRVLGINLCVSPSKTYYLEIPQNRESDDLFSFEANKKTALDYGVVIGFLKDILADKSVLKIGCGLKSQWHILNKLCQVNFDLFPYDDIAVMSYVLDSSAHEHNLTALSELTLKKNLVAPVKNTKTKKIDFSEGQNLFYRNMAAGYIMRIYEILRERIFREKKTYVYENLDRRLLSVLQKMESLGIIVDDKNLAELDEEFSKQIDVLEREIYELAGVAFNLSSPKQVGEVLFEKLGLKSKKNASGSYNTSAAILEQLAEDSVIAAKILEWRMYAKLKSTYTNSLLEARDENNRVHTTFSQTVVNTGRLASSNPNLQNIPNRSSIGQKIRTCFVAKKGYKLVAADYSQMELRLMASVADVKALKEAFAMGKDIHAATASRVFHLPLEAVDKEHRSKAKAINFGIIYGISQFGLAKQIGISREEAKQYIESYFKIMPEVKEYMEKTIRFAHQNECVYTPMGRKCFIAGINDQNQRISSFAERAAINAPIQGGAADIVKLAMQKVDRILTQNNYDAHILLQVHDELVLEVKEEIVDEVAQLVKQAMEGVADTSVPMVVDVGVGDNWHDAH